MSLKKRDLLFVVLVVAVFGTFYAISGKVQTSKVPYDETHEKFYETITTEGKKGTEKYCKECHNAEVQPLSQDHPPAFRCLFCHKMKQDIPQ